MVQAFQWYELSKGASFPMVRDFQVCSFPGVELSKGNAGSFPTGSFPMVRAFQWCEISNGASFPMVQTLDAPAYSKLIQVFFLRPTQLGRTILSFSALFETV